MTCRQQPPCLTNLGCILAGIQTRDDTRDTAASHVEHKRRDSSELVVVELGLVAELATKTGGVLGEVVVQQLSSSSDSERELVLDFTTPLGLAEMSVTDGGKTDRVRCGRGNEALKLLDKGDSSCIQLLAEGGRATSPAARALGCNIGGSARLDVVV